MWLNWLASHAALTATVGCVNSGSSAILPQLRMPVSTWWDDGESRDPCFLPTDPISPSWNRAWARSDAVQAVIAPECDMPYLYVRVVEDKPQPQGVRATVWAGEGVRAARGVIGPLESIEPHAVPVAC